MRIASTLAIVILLSFLIGGCTSRLDSNGCFGYTYDTGLKRGTLLKNQNYTSPYRQCVEKKAPHKNLEKKPYC